jgi:hypothetical protein
MDICYEIVHTYCIVANWKFHGHFSHSYEMFLAKSPQPNSLTLKLNDCMPTEK